MFPEVDKEVGDLACRWQETLQVTRAVAGVTEASRRDDGHNDPQAIFRTGQAQGGKLRAIDDDIRYKTYLVLASSGADQVNSVALIHVKPHLGNFLQSTCTRLMLTLEKGKLTQQFGR